MKTSKTSRTEFLTELKAAKTLKDFAKLREACNYHGSRISEINNAFIKHFPEYVLHEFATINYDFDKIVRVSDDDRSNFGKKFAGKKVRVVRAGNTFRGKFHYTIILVKVY